MSSYKEQLFREFERRLNEAEAEREGFLSPHEYDRIANEVYGNPVAAEDEERG
jgi:hypothetical protein